MTTIKKRSIRYGGVAGKGLVFGAMVLTVAGCVVEPAGYYQTYPHDYSYYDYPQPYSGSTVVIGVDRDEHRDSGRRDHGDYDNHRDYGRRGNGNFHGNDRDDRHDD